MKWKLLFALFTAGFVLSAGVASARDPLPPVSISEVSEDPGYGYTEQNPIKVGGGSEGPSRERAYFQLLRGPNGESVSFTRGGSCCGFKTTQGYMGVGLLDIYEVTIAGSDKPVTLYINMYDYEQPKAPKGFQFSRNSF
jgi:hypothetical protein